MNNSGDSFERLVVVSDRRSDDVSLILRNNGISPAIRKITPPNHEGLQLTEVLVEKDNLEIAVKIIESSGALSVSPNRKSGVNGSILIPVDFSSRSVPGCKIGFALAKRLNLHPVIIHAYPSPFFAQKSQYDSAIGFDETEVDELVEVETSAIVQTESEKLMSKFSKKLCKLQTDGLIPDVKFSTKLSQGVPEDVIDEYCRVSPPSIIVMATRHRDKKRQDMIGSVTVEVLDTLRVPVFAVPENYEFPGFPDIKKLLMFCYLDSRDSAIVENLMKMFSYPEIDITFVPAKFKDSNASDKLESLCNYMTNLYPTASFKFKDLKGSTTREDLEELAMQEAFDMVVVGNRKSNIFSRLFKPGIAHKILFDSDVPLFAIPV